MSGTTRVPGRSPLHDLVLTHSVELHRALGPLGVRRISLFGSVARGEETAESDIDLLVDVAPGVSLFALFRMQREAEAVLESRVDLIPRDGLKPVVAAAIERDAVPL